MPYNYFYPYRRYHCLWCICTSSTTCHLFCCFWWWWYNCLLDWSCRHFMLLYLLLIPPVNLIILLLPLHHLLAATTILVVVVPLSNTILVLLLLLLLCCCCCFYCWQDIPVCYFWHYLFVIRIFFSNTVFLCIYIMTQEPFLLLLFCLHLCHRYCHSWCCYCTQSSICHWCYSYWWHCLLIAVALQYESADFPSSSFYICTIASVYIRSITSGIPVILI